MDKNSASVAFGGCPAFLPEEIDHWLDSALYQEISNKFTGNNVLKTPFEQSVKRIHDLEKLVQSTTLNAFEVLNTNTCTVDLTDSMMYFVDATLNFNDEKAAIFLIDHESAKRFKKTYNNNPWIENPVATIDDSTLRIYYDAITMASATHTVDVTYIKKPTLVSELGNSDMTEIPEYMQYEMVNRAVSLALEDIESRRTQSKLQLSQLDE